MCNGRLTYEELFCLQGCRSYKQYHRMRRRFEESVCEFCNVSRSLNDILFEDRRVMVWHVPLQFMRSGLEFHFLIVPKRHVRFEAQLSFLENWSVWKAKRFLQDRFKYNGGMTFVREGDMSLNAGTVPHLHYNIFVPNETCEIRVPIFKDPAQREANLERARGFSERYKTGEVPE